MGAMTAKELRRLGWVYRLNRWRWALGTLAPAEIFYQQLFDAALVRSGIAVPPLFPVGNAANASLLYVLFRLLWDFPALDLLELGAGQSSLLLDALAQAGRAGSVLTLEHDPQWAARVGGKVAHEVRTAPLRPGTIHGVATQSYDVRLDRRFDAVLVDGPIGTPAHSRWGTLDLLENHLADEFVVVFDDAERPGERQTIARFLDLRPAAGHVFVHAMKSQCLVFTEKYRAVGGY
jgi:predicted O-methyltransferase YrrM